MPMLQRAVHRTSGVIKRFMFKANAEEIAIPALAPNRLWKESGRFESFKDNLFTMEGKSQLLGPVHFKTTSPRLLFTMFLVVSLMFARRVSKVPLNS